MLLSTLSAGWVVLNNIPTYDEQVKGRWAQVKNEYQRLVRPRPRPVETARGHAKQEQTDAAVIVGAAKAMSFRSMPAP
ncbi:hypothetical protein ACVBEG_27355 [Pseudomonas sp. GG8]